EVRLGHNSKDGVGEENEDVDEEEGSGADGERGTGEERVRGSRLLGESGSPARCIRERHASLPVPK
ncbi:MAG: hypothetical protein ACPIOQ_82855, partial [Promethearchaeia archaeon]